MKISTRTIVPFYTALSFALIAGPAFAAPYGLGIGFHGAYGESKDADSGSGLVGAHAEIRPATFLGIVGSVGYKLDEEFRIRVEDEDAIYEVHSIPVTLAGRIYIPVEGFAPYLTAGAQWRHISYDFGDLSDAVDNFTADESETAFGWLIGAGAEISSSSNVGLFAEGRWEFIDADRDLGDNDFEEAENFDYDQWQIMAGLTFYLNSGE